MRDDPLVIAKRECYMVLVVGSMAIFAICMLLK